MNSSPLRVIKLGGSLLETPDWDRRFNNWFDSLPSSRTLLLVGGGPPVDAIRHVASRRAFDAVFMHWLCIDAMDISYRIAQQLLGPAWQCIPDANTLRAWVHSPLNASALIHVRSFYTSSNFQTLPVRLPLNWDTTSDSLAALLATIVAAEELILLKSCQLDAPYDWPALAQAGIVDRAFPLAVGSLSQVRLEHL